MSENSQCCCGNCKPFFFGWGSHLDDFTITNFDKIEELRYNKPRPERRITSTGFYGATERSCPGEQFTKGDYFAPEVTQRAKYAHFNGVKPQETCTYFFQHVSKGFGNPPCEWDTFQSSRVYTDTEQAACCEQVVQGPRCSQTYHVCGTRWDQPSNNLSIRRLSGIQEKLVRAEPIEPIFGMPPRTRRYEHDYAWRWLEGIANHSLDTLYNRWYWNGTTHVRSQPMPLQESLFGIIHQEKWWERYYNNLNPYDNPGDDGEGLGLSPTVANCSCPKWFGFGSTGVPLFTWEIVEAFGTEFEAIEFMDHLLAMSKCQGIRDGNCNTSDGGSVQRRMIDLADVEQLYQKKVIDMQDFRREDGKIIRKQMRPVNRAGFAQYFWGVPGGWTHGCHDIDNGYPNMEAHWPFFTRIFSPNCTATGYDNIPVCMSALRGPMANDGVCTHGGPSACNSCDTILGGALKHPDQILAACGDSFCSPEAINGNAYHCLFTNSSYMLRPDGKVRCLPNMAWLARTNERGLPLINPDTNVWYDLPDSPGHVAAPDATYGILRGETQALNTLCCSAKAGIICSEGQTDCDHPNNFFIPIKLGSEPCEQPAQYIPPPEFGLLRFDVEGSD